MKVFTFGLGLTMLSAQASASLFSENEDFDLQEDWEDVEADRELQDTEDINISGDFPNEPTRSDGDEDDSERGGRKKRGNKGRKCRKGRKGRKCRKNRKNKKGRKGRKGRKNKGGRKGRKGPFVLAKFMENQAEKAEKMDKRVIKMNARGIEKCKKLPEKMEERFCKTWENSEISGDSFNAAQCTKFTMAKQANCKISVTCGVQQKSGIFQCNNDFKMLMMSFRQPEINPQSDAETTGKCYEALLNLTQACVGKAKAAFDNEMGESTPIPETTFQQVQQEMRDQRLSKKDERSKKRSERMSKRKNDLRNNRRKKTRRNNRRSDRGDRRGNRRDRRSRSDDEDRSDSRDRRERRSSDDEDRRN